MNKRIKNKIQKRKEKEAFLSFRNINEFQIVIKDVRKVFINREQTSLIER